MKSADSFVASIDLPADQTLRPEQRVAVKEAFQKFLNEDLVSFLIAQKPRRVGLEGARE